MLGLDGTCALVCEEGFKRCMVGTIALYDAEGERLETIYLGQAPQMGKAEFLDRVDGEGSRHKREAEPCKAVFSQTG